MPEARHWIVLPSAGGQTLSIYYDLSSIALADQVVPNRSTNQHVVFDFEIFIPIKCPGIMKNVASDQQSIICVFGLSQTNSFTSREAGETLNMQLL